MADRAIVVTSEDRDLIAERRLAFLAVEQRVHHIPRHRAVFIDGTFRMGTGGQHGQPAQPLRRR